MPSPKRVSYNLMSSSLNPTASSPLASPSCRFPTPLPTQLPPLELTGWAALITASSVRLPSSPSNPFHVARIQRLTQPTPRRRLPRCRRRPQSHLSNRHSQWPATTKSATATAKKTPDAKCSTPNSISSASFDPGARHPRPSQRHPPQKTFTIREPDIDSRRDGEFRPSTLLIGSLRPRFRSSSGTPFRRTAPFQFEADPRQQIRNDLPSSYREICGSSF